jgi:hypothetical protein
MEWLESRAARPRQARYQAALRLDMNCFIHSKALPYFAPNPYFRFYPRLCTNCARMGYCTVTVHIGAAIRTSAATGAISFA